MLRRLAVVAVILSSVRTLADATAGITPVSCDPVFGCELVSVLAVRQPPSLTKRARPDRLVPLPSGRVSDALLLSRFRSHLIRGAPQQHATLTTPATSTIENVVRGEFVTVFTVRLPSVRIPAPTLGSHVTEVVCICADEQVLDSNAERRVALVTDNKASLAGLSVWKGAVHELIRHSVNQFHPILHADQTVSSVRLLTLPDKTFALPLGLIGQADGEWNKATRIHSIQYNSQFILARTSGV